MSENVPKLRFPEFEGKWEEHNLGKISKIQRGASPRPISSKKWYDKDKKQVGWVRITDVTKSNRVLLKTEDYFSEAGIKKSRFLPKGSLIMSICATIGKPIITGIDTCIHDGFIGFSNLKDVKKEFLYYQLVNLENKFISLGQTGSQANLNSDLVRITKIRVPSLPEQEKMVSFLSKVDEKIEKLEEKQQLWETYKKGIMQQIFNQKLRFKDENGEEYPEWKNKKLKDVVQFSKGKGISKNNISKFGIECIRYGELYTTYKEKITEIVSRTNLQASDLVFSQKNDVIIPTSGETAEDIATASCIMKNGVAIGGDTTIMKTDENGLFLSYYLNNERKKIANLAQGVSVVHLYPDQLKMLELKIPNKKEQTKIANFLSAIEEEIKERNKELELNKKFKKGLLQKMFC